MKLAARVQIVLLGIAPLVAVSTITAFGSVQSVESQVVDRIVATVNDDIVTLSELNREMKPYIDRIRSLGYPLDKERQMLFKVREEMLDKLIGDKLTDQAVKKAKIKVNDKEVDEMIERIKASKMYSDEDMRAALRKDGLTMEEFKAHLKDQILRSKLVNAEVKSKIVITQEDMRAYYDAHRSDFSADKRYRLKNIIMRIPDGAGPAERQAVKERMIAVWQKLKDGTGFEQMAREYSESPTASEGGTLGEFSADVIAAQVRDAIKDLKPGEFTPVLETEVGVQIILVDAVKEKPPKSYEDVMTDIQEKLFREVVDQKFNAWLEDLRSRSHIKVIR